MTDMRPVQTAGAAIAPATVTAFGPATGPGKTTEARPERVAQYRAG